MSTTIDPIEAIKPLFSKAIEGAFGPEFAAEDPVLRPSNHADLQANLAMGLAKKLKKQPRVVAEEICARVERGGVIERLEVAGPGFINVTLTDRWVAAAATAMLRDPRLGVPARQPERVVIDYSSPNIAKEMHVGHLRSSIIGDALARVLSWLGHEVIRNNHVGDWGTPFGMLIEHMLDVGGDRGNLALSELSSLYKQARKKFDADEQFQERSRKRVVALQGGDAETLRLWGILVELSKRYFDEVYQKLDISMTSADIKGESFYNPLLAPLCDELEQQGHTRVDQEALCLFPPGFINKEKQPMPLMLRKKDGGFGYATTDLAAIRYRLQELKATRLLYVIGSPQSQHMAMVFKSAEMLGWLRPPARAEHVAFGSVLGGDRQMLKSRSGESARLVDLLDAAIQRAEQEVRNRFKDLDEETAKVVGYEVGIGAIKYADLSNERIKDYIFDEDRMVQFTGKTGGYIQYGHARIHSIFRKVREETPDQATPGDTITIADGEAGKAERALLWRLLGFADVLASVEQSLQPHLLCTFLYEVASAFAVFYEKCGVKDAPPELKPSRLAICDMTLRVLGTGLNLLGIRGPQRM